MLWLAGYITRYTAAKNCRVFRKIITRLREARKVRLELGGENVHPDQSSGVRPTYKTGLFYHQNCYKKFTKATSVLKRKTDTESATATSTAGSSRVQRTGEHGSTLFPPYCMPCKPEKSIKVKGKKQYPKVLREINAEMSIRGS